MTMSSWTLSDVLGYISICCWLGAQFPSVKSSECCVSDVCSTSLTTASFRIDSQVVENARRKSVEGLSLPFLANWFLGACRSNRCGSAVDGVVSGYRRLHEPGGVYPHTPAAVSSEMTLHTKLSHAKVQTVRSRLTSQRISSSLTSACLANSITTGNSLRHPRLTSELARRHSVPGLLKIVVITEACPWRLQTLQPPQRWPLPNKKFQVPVCSTGSFGEVSMKYRSPL
jgi:hypothetical protein